MAPPPAKFSLSQLRQRPITLPIELYEPVGMLQIAAEEMRFSHLLDNTNKEENATNRMANVMPFAISPYGNTVNRCRKPFDPLTLETYELDKTKELGWKLIAEQVTPDVTGTVAMYIID